MAFLRIPNGRGTESLSQGCCGDWELLPDNQHVKFCLKLTLLLPPLKDLKKSSKKSKGKSKSKQSFAPYSDYPDASTSAQKAPRPVKLKPLKEVLSRLVVQLKKKDDYAFFLKPVNPAQVPGYSDLIKRPMDLGTMTVKVQRGRYRSLEDFADDFRLVTGNAKIFNPPGSIYHAEADKLEVWGLDQISKASSTVIQYETDWNIEIEKDDNRKNEAGRRRCPFKTLEATLRSGAGREDRITKRRKKILVQPPRESTQKGGYRARKTGLGAVPARLGLGTDDARAEAQSAHQTQGKRYKTKKERLRIEKDGPPLLPDGSLDYYEGPVLLPAPALVPDPLTRPQLLPIYPPPPPPAYPPPTPRDTPTNARAARPLVPLTDSRIAFTTTPRAGAGAAPSNEALDGAAQRRAATRQGRLRGTGRLTRMTMHGRRTRWTLARLRCWRGSSRKRCGGAGCRCPRGWRTRTGVLKGRGAAGGGDGGSGAGAEPPVFDAKEYWSTRHAVDAEGYIRDVVYGGVDGLAYVAEPGRIRRDAAARQAEEDVDMDSTQTLPLGTTLASWVAQNVIGPLTEGRHALLQRTARELIAPTPAPKPENGLGNPTHPDDDKLPALVSAALHVHPRAAAALAALLQIHSQKIDMAALVRAPADLAQSEEDNGPAEMNAVLDYVAGVICRLQAERERDGSVKQEVADVPVNEEGAGESAVMRNLRLNLLALVKRAPVDTLAIAQLPVGLLPEQVWQYMPTMNGVMGNPQA
ncbi:hypothetical protein B0H14DRAFT_2586080 [Mycena olivaceomarginata]|nr:hypothetical protein B0H14DRAFT_2586080 [Mycena olivaceomarginata]